MIHTNPINDSKFQFHEYCGFCKNRCEDVTISSDYILVTNIWNEKENIEQTFDWISMQTKKPRIWLWIDDGSADGSKNEIERCQTKLPETEFWVESMPSKTIGNLDTIGVAYQKILPALIKKIDQSGVEYFAVMDVDTEPCPNYFPRLIWLLERYQKIGVVAGIPLGEVGKRRVKLPMGGGKVVRWSIVRQIQEYWDIAPDTLLNIKALARGYTLRTFRVPLRLERPTTGFSSKGVFRLGRLNYYVGRPFWAVFFRALRRLFLRDHGTQMMRGYLYERKRGTWNCTDPDVLKYYGRGSNPISALIDVIRYVGNE